MWVVQLQAGCLRSKLHHLWLSGLRQRRRQRQTQRERQMEGQRATEIDAETEIQRQTQRQRDTETERDRDKSGSWSRGHPHSPFPRSALSPCPSLSTDLIQEDPQGVATSLGISLSLSILIHTVGMKKSTCLSSCQIEHLEQRPACIELCPHLCTSSPGLYMSLPSPAPWLNPKGRAAPSAEGRICAGTLLPSAQRFVWAARQPLGNAALGALFA